MKEITVQDCLSLQKKFNSYTETAEQRQFVMLLMVDIKLQATIERIKEVGKVENQKEARAMFRVVLQIIGEDYSQYEEDEKRLQQNGSCTLQLNAARRCPRSTNYTLASTRRSRRRRRSRLCKRTPSATLQRRPGWRRSQQGSRSKDRS